MKHRVHEHPLDQKTFDRTDITRLPDQGRRLSFPDLPGLLVIASICSGGSVWRKFLSLLDGPILYPASVRDMHLWLLFKFSIINANM